MICKGEIIRLTMVLDWPPARQNIPPLTRVDTNMNHCRISQISTARAKQGGQRYLRRANMLMIIALLLSFCAMPTGVGWTKDKAPDPDAPVFNLVTEPEKPKLEQNAYLDQVVNSDEYRVGPGDRIAITIIGTTPDKFDLAITPEATLVVPAVGVVDMKGLTLTEAKARLMKVLSEYYPKASPSVSLLEVRHFRVTVVGAVENPGLITVTANTRASEAVQDAGLRTDAGMRSLRLLRGTDTLRVDLVAFLNLGNLDLNPYLMEGDILQIPAVDRRWGYVDIQGAVVTPGRFELAPNDRIGDIIDLAYGLVPNADTTRLELWRFTKGEREALRVEWPQGSTYSIWRQTPLRPDDRVIIRDIEGYHSQSSVYVNGEVTRPGVYVFPGEAVSLLQVIDSAGGFTLEADLAHAYVIRKATPTWQTERATRVAKIPVEILSRLESDWIQAEALSMPGRVSTNFVALFAKGELNYDLMLANGDQVIVPKQTNYVNVIGQVVQPGLVAHDPDGTLSYYLERVGGYAWRADRGRTFVLKGGTGAAVKRGQVRSLDPGDIIVVPTKRDRDWWSTFKESMVVVANLATIYLVVDQATR